MDSCCDDHRPQGTGDEVEESLLSDQSSPTGDIDSVMEPTASRDSAPVHVSTCSFRDLESSDSYEDRVTSQDRVQQNLAVGGASSTNPDTTEPTYPLAASHEPAQSITPSCAGEVAHQLSETAPEPRVNNINSNDGSRNGMGGENARWLLASPFSPDQTRGNFVLIRKSERDRLEAINAEYHLNSCRRPVFNNENQNISQNTSFPASRPPSFHSQHQPSIQNPEHNIGPVLEDQVENFGVHQNSGNFQHHHLPPELEGSFAGHEDTQDADDIEDADGFQLPNLSPEEGFEGFQNSDNIQDDTGDLQVPDLLPQLEDFFMERENVQEANNIQDADGLMNFENPQRPNNILSDENIDLYNVSPVLVNFFMGAENAQNGIRDADDGMDFENRQGPDNIQDPEDFPLPGHYQMLQDDASHGGLPSSVNDLGWTAFGEMAPAPVNYSHLPNHPRSLHSTESAEDNVSVNIRNFPSPKRTILSLSQNSATRSTTKNSSEILHPNSSQSGETGGKLELVDEVPPSHLKYLSRLQDQRRGPSAVTDDLTSSDFRDISRSKVSRPNSSQNLEAADPNDSDLSSGADSHPSGFLTHVAGQVNQPSLPRQVQQQRYRKKNRTEHLGAGDEMEYPNDMNTNGQQNPRWGNDDIQMNGQSGNNMMPPPVRRRAPAPQAADGPSPFPSRYRRVPSNNLLDNLDQEDAEDLRVLGHFSGDLRGMSFADATAVMETQRQRQHQPQPHFQSYVEPNNSVWTPHPIASHITTQQNFASAMVAQSHNVQNNSNHANSQMMNAGPMSMNNTHGVNNSFMRNSHAVNNTTRSTPQNPTQNVGMRGQNFHTWGNNSMGVNFGDVNPDNRTSHMTSTGLYNMNSNYLESNRAARGGFDVHNHDQRTYEQMSDDVCVVAFAALNGGNASARASIDNNSTNGTIPQAMRSAPSNSTNNHARSNRSTGNPAANNNHVNNPSPVSRWIPPSRVSGLANDHDGSGDNSTPGGGLASGNKDNAMNQQSPQGPEKSKKQSRHRNPANVSLPAADAQANIKPAASDQRQTQESMQTQAGAIANPEAQTPHSQIAQPQRPGNGPSTAVDELRAVQEQLRESARGLQEFDSIVRNARPLENPVRPTRRKNYNSDAMNLLEEREKVLGRRPVFREFTPVFNQPEPELTFGEQIAQAIHPTERRRGAVTEEPTPETIVSQEEQENLRRTTLVANILHGNRQYQPPAPPPARQLPPLPELRELALGHLRLEQTQEDEEMFGMFINEEALQDDGGSDEIKKCCFCDDKEYNQHGVTNQKVFLPEEAFPGFCNECNGSGNSFSTEMQAMGFDVPDTNFYDDFAIDQNFIGQSEAFTGRRVFGSAEEFIANNGRPARGVTRVRNPMNGRDVTVYQAIQTCRGQIFNQIDCRKGVICAACKKEKTDIIKHRLHTEFEPYQRPGAASTYENNDIPSAERRLATCMMCMEGASVRCKGCPLRLCSGCETILRHSCSGHLDSLFYEYGRLHLKNDAFLLRSDGGGF